MAIQEKTSEKIFNVFNIIFLLFIVFITLYPFVLTLSLSLSDSRQVLDQRVWLLPKGFNLDAYNTVFSRQDIWTAYYNTLWYTVVGTLINIVFTMMAAYALSRKQFFARNFVMVLVIIPMFFSGGLIPTFILINKLHMYNTRWAIVIPAAIDAWNLIIARVYMQSTIPDSLVESAKIDGYNDIGILLRIIIPLSKPVMAVLALFCAVGFWNSFFAPLIYLKDNNLKPISLLLYNLLVMGQTLKNLANKKDAFQVIMLSMKLKYAMIMITILPIICVYPFLQKYFIKGVMIGAIKE